MLLLVGTIVSCTDRTPEGEHAIESSFVERTIELEVRIGSVDDPDQSLTEVGQVLIGPEHRLYITQPREASIRVYDAAGALVNTIGRRGEGPGEFGEIGHAGLRGDTLYVADSRLGRLSYLGLDGRELGSTSWVTPASFQGVLMYLPTAPQILLADGTALAKPHSGEAAMRWDGTGVRSSTARVPILHLGRRAEEVDTVVWHEIRNSVVAFMSGGTRYIVQSPFRDSPLVELMPTGSGALIVERSLASAEAGDAAFSVTLVGPSRDTVFSRSIPYAPLPITAEDIRWTLDRAPIDPSEDPPPVSERERVLRGAGLIPTSRVPVTDVAVGQDGSIWIRREEMGGNPVLWNMLDARGVPDGSVRLPADQSIVGAAGDFLLAIERDELDVPYVLRYRINR